MTGVLDLNIAGHVLTAVMRYLGPALAALILLRCAIPLLTFRQEPEVWGWLIMPDGGRKALKHWENLVGRHRKCDVVLDLPVISRNHCVLTRYDDGSWTVTDTDSKGGVRVNDKAVSIGVLRTGDKLNLAGLELIFEPISPNRQRCCSAAARKHRDPAAVF